VFQSSETPSIVTREGRRKPGLYATWVVGVVRTNSRGVLGPVTGDMAVKALSAEGRGLHLVSQVVK
jgi:hypothetical protein